MRAVFIRIEIVDGGKEILNPYRARQSDREWAQGKTVWTRLGLRGKIPALRRPFSEPLNCPPGDTIEEEKYMKQRKTSRNWGVVFLFVMWVILLLAPGAVYGATSGDGSTTFGSVFEITP
jgi:hypothetical protein